MIRYPPHLLRLIDVLKKLPGIGSKSAERFAFHLLDWPEEKQIEMAEVIRSVKQHLKNCLVCGALIEKKCVLCTDLSRDQETLCIVATSKDLFAIEETREYRGLYHVLGALFSPIHGKKPQAEVLEGLLKRVEEKQIKEIIIALDSTLEGDATALYIKRELSAFSARVSRLALGLPMGSALDYIDGGTLGRALAGRHTY